MLEPLISPNGIRYVTRHMIEDFHGEEECYRFLFWVSGQTYMIIDEKPAYYYWDYKHWVEGLPILD